MDIQDDKPSSLKKSINIKRKQNLKHTNKTFSSFRSATFRRRLDISVLRQDTDVAIP